MKSRIGIILAWCAAFGGGPAWGQGSVGNGTFQDLDFSSGAVVYYPGNPGLGIEAGPALPGWTASIGGVDQSTILYDVYTGSCACVTLIGPTTPFGPGTYELYLVGLFTQTAAIQQTGIVPLGANTIQFQSQYYPLNVVNPFVNVSDGLTINGQPVSLTAIGMQNNVWTYAGNISQFAGRTATIEFYASDPIGFGSWNLNDIIFSSQSIPEPGTVALAGLGGLAMFVLGRTRRSN
jgi:hypothetical protein